MKVVIFLVFLTVTYADQSIPIEGENCAQKCQDQCLPCENICREQALGHFGKCESCESQCRACLSQCYEQGSDIDEGLEYPSLHFIPIGCRTCLAQCKACRASCGSSGHGDCGDCEARCQRCGEVCSHGQERVKRHQDLEKKEGVEQRDQGSKEQEGMDCQKMCQNDCARGTGTRCQECMDRCRRDRNQGQEQPNLIPLGSCRKCMTFCNLCQVQCQGSQVGNRNCDRCHERCSQCREICSPRKQPDGEEHDQGQDDLIPLGSCRKCMTFCNLCQVQCQNSRLGDHNCDRCHERCSQCNEMRGPEKREKRNSHLVCDLKCQNFCNQKGQEQKCKECLESCQQQGGWQHGKGQGNHGAQEGQREADCPSKCLQFCSSRKTTQQCQECMESCHVEGYQEGQEHENEGKENRDCQQQCMKVCKKYPGSQMCENCLNGCQQGGEHQMGHGDHVEHNT